VYITFDEFDMKRRDDNDVDVNEQQRQEIMDQKFEDCSKIVFTNASKELGVDLSSSSRLNH
jgi:hypothetical protein